MFVNIEAMNELISEIDLNCDKFDEKSLLILIKNLELITDKLKIEENRIVFYKNINYCKTISKIFHSIEEKIKENENNLISFNNSFLLIITQLFRLLRNSCLNYDSKEPSVFTIGINDNQLFEHSSDVFRHVFSFYKTFKTGNELVSKQLILSIKSFLQYIANSMSGRNGQKSSQELKLIKDKVWKIFAFDLFRYLLIKNFS
jgi:hypothetical protein